MHESISFESPKRQSLLGVLVYLAKNGRAVLSAIIVLWATTDKLPFSREIIVGFVLLIVIFALVMSYLQYLNFTFHIEGNELIVRSGVLFKERKIIPFERIQSVHTHQNLIQQILNLTSLKVDSAGSQGKELEIPALDRATAEALKTKLNESPTDISTGDEKIEEVKEAQSATNRELLSLNIEDLLKVGLTENHLKSGLLAFAVVYGYYSQYQEYLGEYIDTNVETYLPELMRLGLIMVIAGAGVFLVASVILSLVNTFLRYFDFKAWLDEATININAGLLKRNQYRVPVNKVQYMVWGSNPLRKLLKFETAAIKQAQSTEMKKKENISIPACRSEHTTALESLLFGREVIKGATEPIRANTMAHVRLATLIFTPPLLIGFTVLYFTTSSFYFSIFLALPLVWFFAYKFGQSVGIEIQNDLIIVKQGWVFPRRVIFPLHKAQAVDFNQSVFLARRKLANVRIYTAAGSIRVRYLPEDAVNKLLDYCLLRVETFKGKWM